MYHSLMRDENLGLENRVFVLLNIKILGLTFFEASEEKLEVKFISGKGNVHYTATIWKKTAV